MGLRRCRIIGGPWPERVGCVGTVVEPTPEQAKFYPFHGRGRGEVIVLLDDDPLDCEKRGCRHGDADVFRCGRSEPEWTCAISQKSVEIVEGE